MVTLPYSYGTSTITGEGFTTGCGEGYYTHYSFYNYCPLCGHSECLMQGYKRYDEISCTICGADFSFSGKEKMYNPSGWLTPYTPPEPSVHENQTIQKKKPVVSKKEIAQKYIHRTVLI